MCLFGYQKVQGNTSTWMTIGFGMSCVLESCCPNLNSSENLFMRFGSCFLREMVFSVLTKEGSKSCLLSRYLHLKSQNTTPYPVGPASHTAILDAQDGKYFNLFNNDTLTSRSVLIEALEYSL